MRTGEERIAAMHARADELKNRQREHRVRIMQAVSIVIAVVAVVLLAVFMPQIQPEAGAASSLPGNMQASIFADSGALGYVVIAVIAFLLGSAVTIFCFRLKKWQDAKSGETEAGSAEDHND